MESNSPQNEHMYPLHRLLRVTMFLLCSLAITCHAATAPAVVPDEQDRQVLEALLLHLRADAKFPMTRVPVKGSTIVLNPRTPVGTAFLNGNMSPGDLDNHAIPAELIDELRRRNTPVGTEPGSHDAVETSYDKLTFADGIIVGDTAASERPGPNYRPFQTLFPKARGWVCAFLPGYSKDGSQAVVRGFAGPWAHAATVTALLVKAGNRWSVTWYHVTFYA